MSEDHHRLEPEVIPYTIKVVGIGLDAYILGSHPVCRPAPSPLVVVDEAVGVGESIQFRKQVVVVEVGPTMKDDHRSALANLTEVKETAVDL
jgi:hypothetical protein